MNRRAHDLAASGPEWLLTTGTGCCARGTASGIPARRAHGLFTTLTADGAATLLMGFDERLHIERTAYDLMATLGSGPEHGFQPALVLSFRADPWPVWDLRCGETRLERSLLLLHGHDALIVAWRHLEGPPGRLRVGPRIVARPPYGLQRETPAMLGVAQGIPGRVRIETLPGQPALTLWHQGSFLPVRQWQRGMVYPADPVERPAAVEDAFLPGFVEAAFGAGDALHLVLATEEALFRTLAFEGRLGATPPSTLGGCIDVLCREEIARLDGSLTAALAGARHTAGEAAAAHDGAATPTAATLDPADGWTTPLIRGVERGIARLGGRLTLIDDFPAATAATGDALRALPGVIAVRGFEIAREIVRDAVARLDDGLVVDGPGRAEPPETSIWLILAAERLAVRSDDLDLAGELLPPLESIVQYFRAGTRPGVRVNALGLLETDGPGGPVAGAGLNALWQHALVAMARLARLCGRRESSAFHLAWARQHGQDLTEHLWDDAAGCLHAALAPGGPRAGLGPEQVWLLGCGAPPLPAERSARLLDRIATDLATPWGLRAAPGDRCVGTAWLGAWHSARLRVLGRRPAVLEAIDADLRQLRERLQATALGFVPARYVIAEQPRRAATPAIAEGVSTIAAAELLRLWVEDVAHVHAPAAASR